MAIDRRHRQAIFTEINITPLTDVFLVLLIMMMVLTPLLDSQGLSLSAPSIEASSSVPKESKAITIRVAPEGHFFIDAEEIYSSQFITRIEQMKESHPDGLVVLIAPDALHGDLVKVLDAAKQSHLKKIAVVRDTSL